MLVLEQAVVKLGASGGVTGGAGSFGLDMLLRFRSWATSCMHVLSAGGGSRYVGRITVIVGSLLISRLGARSCPVTR